MLSRFARLGSRSVKRKNYCTKSEGPNGDVAQAKPAFKTGAPQTTHVLTSWQQKKAELVRPSIGMQLSTLAVVLGIGYFTYNQMTEEKNVDNEMESILTAMTIDPLDLDAFLEDSQKATKQIKGALDKLPGILTTHRRVFSGDIYVPVSPEVLARYEKRLINCLLNCTKDQYENRWRALSILDRLAASHESVRSRLRDPEALSYLFYLGTRFSPTDSPRNEWLIAANIILNLLQDPEANEILTDLGITGLPRFVDRYGNEPNPLAAIVHARLCELIAEPIPGTGFSKRTEENIINQALLETRAFESSPQISGASIYSAFAFAALGGIWGRMRWIARLTSHAAWTSHAWSWSRSMHIARPLALWFLLDMFGQRLITFASNEKFEFKSDVLKDLKEIETRTNLTGTSISSAFEQLDESLAKIPGTQNISLASAITHAQNLSFGLFSIWLIRARRYAFLPLAAAGIYNYADTINKIPEVQYVREMGKIQAENAQKTFESFTSSSEE